MSGYLLIDPGPTCAVVRLDDGVILWAEMWSPEKVVSAVGARFPFTRPATGATATVIVEQTAAQAKPLGHDFHETIQIAGWIKLEGHYHYTRNQVLNILQVPSGTKKAGCKAAALDAWRREYAPGTSDRELLNSRLCRRRGRKGHWREGREAIDCDPCDLCQNSGYEHVAPLAAMRGPGSHFFDALALWAAHLAVTR